MDYIRQGYRYSDDMKAALFVPHGESLVEAINEVLDFRYREKVYIIFKERYHSDENSNFFFEMPTSSMPDIRFVTSSLMFQVCSLIFDYLGCVYIITKQKQILSNCHRHKIQDLSKVDVSFNMLE